MSMTKLCERCKRRLKFDALTCVCGWNIDDKPKAVIQCCFDGCKEPAKCNVSTKTGRANVCLSHYPQIERYSPLSSFASEIREKTRASVKGNVPVAKAM